MEIDITSFFENADPFEFSHSIAEDGPNAGPETWQAALKEGAETPLLTTPEQLDALRDHMRGYGAWEDDEIDAWSPAECNAMFIQLISGDIREAGLEGQEIDEIDMKEYEKFCEDQGGSLYFSADRAYYYLGD
jgi:hypothetical protein